MSKTETVFDSTSRPDRVLNCCINAITQISDNEYIYDDDHDCNILVTDAYLVAERIKEDTKLIKMLVEVIEDFMPNIGKCVLQDYGRLNTALIEADKRLKEDGE